MRPVHALLALLLLPALTNAQDRWFTKSGRIRFDATAKGSPEDIVGNTAAVFVHRIMPRGSMEFGDAQAARRIVQHVLETVPSPA